MGTIREDSHLRPRQTRLYHGELPAPSPNDLSYKTWLAKNSIVLAWLINLMDPKISRRYLWFKTAKEVWDVARRMYSDLGNASQIFEIRSKLKEMNRALIP